MSSADRRQRVAAVVRRVPGYRAARERVLPRVRGNAALTDIVWRVFRPETDLGAAETPLRAGRHVTGPGVARLPVVGFDLLAVPDDGLPAAVEGIARLQRETLAFRPVLLLGAPAFALAREHGFVADVIASVDAWWGDPGDHPAYVARRMVSARQNFRLWHLVRVAPDGTVPEADARLLAAVPGAMHPGPEAGDTSVRAVAPS